jgi:hypothetical protein
MYSQCQDGAEMMVVWFENEQPLAKLRGVELSARGSSSYCPPELDSEIPYSRGDASLGLLPRFLAHAASRRQWYA